MQSTSRGDLESFRLDAEIQVALRNDPGRPSSGRREDYALGFGDGFETAFCQAWNGSRRSKGRRVWDPALGRYREEKPGQVWDPNLGRYRDEKPGQVWDPNLGRYRDRDPKRDGPPPQRDAPPPGRHRHAGRSEWCTDKH